MLSVRCRATRHLCHRVIRQFLLVWNSTLDCDASVTRKTGSLIDELWRSRARSKHESWRKRLLLTHSFFVAQRKWSTCTGANGRRLSSVLSIKRRERVIDYVLYELQMKCSSEQQRRRRRMRERREKVLLKYAMASKDCSQYLHQSIERWGCINNREKRAFQPIGTRPLFGEREKSLYLRGRLTWRRITIVRPDGKRVIAGRNLN